MKALLETLVSEQLATHEMLVFLGLCVFQMTEYIRLKRLLATHKTIDSFL